MEVSPLGALGMPRAADLPGGAMKLYIYKHREDWPYPDELIDDLLLDAVAFVHMRD